MSQEITRKYARWILGQLDDLERVDDQYRIGVLVAILGELCATDSRNMDIVRAKLRLIVAGKPKN